MTKLDSLLRDYIEGTLSPWDRVELHRLITKDDQARHRFARLRQVSRALPILAEGSNDAFAIKVMGTIQKDHRSYGSSVMRQIRLVPQPKRSRMAWLGTMAAAAAVVLGLGHLMPELRPVVRAGSGASHANDESGSRQLTTGMNRKRSSGEREG
jgi:anti-sigma factor RsiW